MGTRLEVNKKEYDGQVLYYIDFGDAGRGFRLWVSSALVEREGQKEFITVPMTGVVIKKTDKGTLVLKRGEDNLFVLSQRCGYRGKSRIVVVSPVREQIPYWEYHSPRGNLGVSMGMVVTTDRPSVTYTWERTGRLYGGASKGVTRVSLDGKSVSIEGVDAQEMDELFEELEG